MLGATFGGYSFYQWNVINRKFTSNYLWLFLCPFNRSTISTYLYSSECIFRLWMHHAYFHSSPQMANSIFIWIQFKMSMLCINASCINGLHISFSLHRPRCPLTWHPWCPLPTPMVPSTLTPMVCSTLITMVPSIMTPMIPSINTNGSLYSDTHSALYQHPWSPLHWHPWCPLSWHPWCPLYKTLALTMGFESESRSLRASRKPWSSTSWALMSCSLATHTAAVFLT